MNRTVERTIVHHNGKYMIKETTTIYLFQYIIYSFDVYKKTAYELYYGEKKAQSFFRFRNLLLLFWNNSLISDIESYKSKYATGGTIILNDDNDLINKKSSNKYKQKLKL